MVFKKQNRFSCTMYKLLFCIWWCHCIKCTIWGISSDRAFFSLVEPNGYSWFCEVVSRWITNVCFSDGAMVVLMLLTPIATSLQYPDSVWIITLLNYKSMYTKTLWPLPHIHVHVHMVRGEKNDMARVEEVKLVPLLGRKMVIGELENCVCG